MTELLIFLVLLGLAIRAGRDAKRRHELGLLAPAVLISAVFGFAAAVVVGVL